MKIIKTNKIIYNMKIKNRKKKYGKLLYHFLKQQGIKQPNFGLVMNFAKRRVNHYPVEIVNQNKFPYHYTVREVRDEWDPTYSEWDLDKEFFMGVDITEVRIP